VYLVGFTIEIHSSTFDGIHYLHLCCHHLNISHYAKSYQVKNTSVQKLGRWYVDGQVCLTKYKLNYLLKRVKHNIVAIIKTTIAPGYSACVHKSVGGGRRWKTNRFYQCTSLSITADQCLIDKCLK